MRIWHKFYPFYSLFERNWMHEPKRIFCDKPITALTQNYSVNLERIFLTIPLREREFCQIRSYMNACPPHQNLDWSSCVAHSRSMWWKRTAHGTYNAPKNAKKKKKKGKESFYLGNLRILKFQFDNCHARGENRFTNRYKNLSIVTDV